MKFLFQMLLWKICVNLSDLWCIFSVLNYGLMKVHLNVYILICLSTNYSVHNISIILYICSKLFMVIFNKYNNHLVVIWVISFIVLFVIRPKDD